MQVYKYQNNAFFVFYNANSKGKNASDCVARAISVALSKTWEDTIREMTELGISIGRVFNEDKTIDKYLAKYGFIKYKEPRKANNTKMSIREFLTSHPTFTGLINAGSHHIALAVNGKIHDTWDSSLKIMHCYYLPPKDMVIKVEIPKEKIEL